MYLPKIVCIITYFAVHTYLNYCSSSYNNSHINKNHIIYALKSNARRVCSTHNSGIINNNNNNNNNTIVYPQTELYSYADSIVAGSNYCIMHYTNR